MDTTKGNCHVKTPFAASPIDIMAKAGHHKAGREAD